MSEDRDNNTRLERTRELIAELHKIDSEVVVPSEGEPFVEKRDPHLRLRRTLTPPSKFKGCSAEEAQFMISGSAGERVSLSFSCFGQDFVCDGYFFGTSEEKAAKRIFAVHGVTPGISRMRWHSLGEGLAKQDPDVRYCAIDWHSLDRTDRPQDEFLTMLPKHFFDSVDDDLFQRILTGLPADKAAKQKKLLDDINQQCPRSNEDGAIVLRAMIEQGCGWGKNGKSFALCIKSWSGGIGMQMLIDAAKKENEEFQRNIAGAVIMHPAYFKEQGITEAIEGLPVIMCWARDDPKVPYKIFSQYYLEAGAKILGPESGGHANFNEFDKDAAKFLVDLTFT